MGPGPDPELQTSALETAAPLPEDELLTVDEVRDVMGMGQDDDPADCHVASICGAREDVFVCNSRPHIGPHIYREDGRIVHTWN